MRASVIVGPVEQPALVQRPEDLTAEWLTSVLRPDGSGAVRSFDVTRIGTGQMSENHRIALDWSGDADGPGTVVLKVAASDQGSRNAAVGLGIYEREVRFYEQAARCAASAPPTAARAWGGRSGTSTNGWTDSRLQARRRMAEDDHMTPRPAPARCTSCEREWHSATMIDGLRMMSGCLRCGGQIEFAPDVAPAPAHDAVADRDVQPHLVLGIPRR